MKTNVELGVCGQLGILEGVNKRKHGVATIARRVMNGVRSKRLWKWVAIVAGGVIILQLLFPYDRAFFLSRLDGQPVGLKSEAEIASEFASRYTRAVVTTHEPDSSSTLADLGVKVDTVYTADAVTDYPVWQRLIPLSAIVKLFHHDHLSRASYLKLSLDEWAESLSNKCTVSARDAGVEIKEGKLSLVKSSEGASCSKADLIAQLKKTPLSEHMNVAIPKKVVKPKRSDGEVQAQIQKIQKVIDQGVTVSVLGTTTKAEPSEIVGWLTFSDGEQGQLKLDVDPAKMQDFIARVQRPVYVAPGTTTITMRDGVETSRSAGAEGRGINSADLITQLRTQLNEQKSIAIQAKESALPAKQVFSRSYTNSTPGLQALINDIASEKGNMSIAITELDGQRRNLAANGDKQYHPASTYKLFIAYGVIKRIEANQWKWNDQVNGMSVDDCLTKMIVNSDNACAEAFAEKMGGWGAVQADVRATGATSTNLNLAEPVGTVKDQVLFLQKLQDNQLMKQENRDKLLALMKRQQYRAGIPAGVSSEVADKVGFLGANLHDSGLVYTPRGIYALSIYSTGGSWSAIADAARRVEALLAS